MLALWQVLSLAYPPLVVPPISAVGKILARILSAPDLLHEAAKTLGRLGAGLFFGVASGCLVGYVCGVCKTCRELCKPVLGVLQVVPPVALLVLAIIRPYRCGCDFSDYRDFGAGCGTARRPKTA